MNNTTDSTPQALAVAKGSALSVALARVREYNAWRRGEGELCPSPRDIGEAIDLVCRSAEESIALQDTVNDFVCSYWHEIHAGGLAYTTSINPELLERARALYRPNNRDDQRSAERK